MARYHHRERSAIDVRQLLSQGEGRILERKRDLSSLSPVLKTLVAFANTAGGTLLVGIEDDGTVAGLDGVRDQEERLANTIADSIEPALLPDIEVVSVDGHDLLMVRVARWPGPFFLRSKGPEKGVYVRLGSTNRRADGQTLAELRLLTQRLAFDQEPCGGTTLRDLDLDAAREAFATVGRELDEAKLESLGVVCRRGAEIVPSNGGVILFGRGAARRRYFPDAQARCALFRGTTKARFIDRKDIDGTVLDALYEVPTFIERNTRLAARIESMRREDIPEYPQVALREGLTNAIAHTDYTQRGMQIMVAIFSNRLEIQNPGTLPFPMTLDDLKRGVSRIRNPVITRVLRELDFMEEWGTGYRRISEDCAQGGYPVPDWEELGAVVRIVFRPHPEAQVEGGGIHGATPGAAADVAEGAAAVGNNVAEGTAAVGNNVAEGATAVGNNVAEDATAVGNDVAEGATAVGNDVAAVGRRVGVDDNRKRGAAADRQAWFLDQLRDFQSVGVKELASYFGVTRRTAERDLADLTRRGLVIFVGRTRGGRYRLPGQEVSPGADKGVNERQRWLLARLGKTVASAGATELASRFGVSARTAQRDLADLVRRGLIYLVGSHRTGRYGLREPGSPTG